MAERRAARITSAGPIPVGTPCRQDRAATTTGEHVVERATMTSIQGERLYVRLGESQVPRLRVNGRKTGQSLRIRDPASPPLLRRKQYPACLANRDVRGRYVTMAVIRSVAGIARHCTTKCGTNLPNYLVLGKGLLF